MPFLKLSTNVAIHEHQVAHLLQQLSVIVASETGKPERYVMIELSGNNSLLFAGNTAPLAYLECKSIGLTASQAKALSKALCTFLENSLAIALDRIYIEFSNCPAEFWGWNGATFA